MAHQAAKIATEEASMITVYGHPMSTCTRKVLMTLNETGTPFEMSVVDFATGAHKQPPHVARQPFGRVPALTDDGFEMFESRAMCRYINDKASGKLMPHDAKDRARVEQWISVETSEFAPNAMKFIYEHVFKRPQTPEVLDAAGKGLTTALEVMEKQLTKSAFLVGNELTLADVVYMPYVEYLMASPAKEFIAKHPHVAAWWNKISERPSWKKTTAKA
jgi:glutathione S-transferase